jgi:Lrp/AsnC family transcriptional regulator for asnA, asnC and gidA
LGNDDTLDYVDMEIVQALQQDGRQSFREVARQLGMTEATVRARVRRMQDADKICFRALVNPRAVSMNCIAYVGVTVKDDMLSDVTSALAVIDAFIYVAVSLGRFNVVCMAFCPSREDLSDILIQKVSSLPGVIRTETMEVLEVFRIDNHYRGQSDA